jgi:hypothetical protein
MPSTRSKASKEVKVKAESKPLSVKQEINVENIKVEKKVKAEHIEGEKPTVRKPIREVDENGEPYWKLGRNRRLTISKYKGVEYVHIRMFYADDETGES